MADEASVFETLRVVNCEKHVEQKGRFAYLSWPWAVDALLERYPKATWEVKKSKDEEPYLVTASGMFFVEVSVTVQGITRSHIHPVLDNSNKPIKEPNAFQINTSIMRCLVKAIALHGLGLYIYAGEDLPPAPGAKRGKRAPKPLDDPPPEDDVRVLRNTLRRLVKDAKDQGWTLEGIKDAFKRDKRDLAEATKNPEQADVLILQGLVSAPPATDDEAPF